MESAVALIDPKYIHNVAAAVRAASCFGASSVLFTGERAQEHMGTRLPREERMKAYRSVRWWNETSPRPFAALAHLTPVAVELLPGAERLETFHHPEDALYVFGPEDGAIPGGIRSACHRFVVVPTYHCMNLSAAAYVVLFHRALDLHARLGVPMPELVEPRGEDALAESDWWTSTALEEEPA
ncbi:MAG TPA: TrmH family RNA methyltransferase [Acidimicrobiales bacterium]|nr:TrmH family RNA methyltransferase [Acidimicrobiales bacterium]